MIDLQNILLELIGEDKDLSMASLGKERDDKFYKSNYAIQESAKNVLRGEQRAKIPETIAKIEDVVKEIVEDVFPHLWGEYNSFDNEMSTLEMGSSFRSFFLHERVQKYLKEKLKTNLGAKND